MTRHEVLSAVHEIFFEATDNLVVSGLLDKLEEALPHSDISDLIFHDFRGLTPEQIVDEAFKREAEHVAQSGGA